MDIVSNNSEVGIGTSCLKSLPLKQPSNNYTAISSLIHWYQTWWIHAFMLFTSISEVFPIFNCPIFILLTLYPQFPVLNWEEQLYVSAAVHSVVVHLEILFCIPRYNKGFLNYCCFPISLPLLLWPQSYPVVGHSHYNWSMDDSGNIWNGLFLVGTIPNFLLCHCEEVNSRKFEPGLEWW